MPGYIVVQLIGATLAALFLHAVINVSAMYGSNYPAHGYSSWAGLWGSPISWRVDEPGPNLGPDLVSTTFTGYWVTWPVRWPVIIAFILRGAGGGTAGSGAAQGDIFTETYEAGKSTSVSATVNWVRIVNP